MGLQAEHFGLIVIGEDFCVATPIDHGIECLLGRRVAQIVLKLLLEAHPGRPMARALVEHMLDVLGQRHRSKQVSGKNLLARLRVEVGELARRGAQQNVTLSDFGKPEVVEDFGDREQVIDLELQGARDFRQIRLAVIGAATVSIRPAIILVETGGNRLPICSLGIYPAAPAVGRAVIFAYISHPPTRERPCRGGCADAGT